MGFLTGTILFALSLFLTMVGGVEIGYRKGKNDLSQDQDGKIEGLGTIDSAIFGLLGLLLAFTFTNALSGLNSRRASVVNEANAIGTAYLRLDLLAPADQATLRPLYREYLEERIKLYASFDSPSLTQEILAKTTTLQTQIWRLTSDAVLQEKHPAIMTLALSAANEMIDSASARNQAAINHPPKIVYLFLFTFAVVSALLIGYNLANNPKRPYFHVVLFCFLISTVVYVIVDLEYPRKGLFQIQMGDQVLTDTLEGMR
jgi:hypothetical protein